MRWPLRDGHDGSGRQTRGRKHTKPSLPDLQNAKTSNPNSFPLLETLGNETNKIVEQRLLVANSRQATMPSGSVGTTPALRNMFGSAVVARTHA